MIFPRAAAATAGPFVAYLVSSFHQIPANNPSQSGIIHFLSNGNDPYNFIPLNENNPVMTSQVGSKAARDPFLVQTPNKDFYWTLATDLDINQVHWKDAVSHGTKNILVWNSTDLVHWKDAYLLRLEDKNAGYVWAPSASYQPDMNIWFIFYSANMYDDHDINHTGPSRHVIRYTTTKDFKTTTPSANYIAGDQVPVLDQEFLYIGDYNFARFLKDEKSQSVYQQISAGGLFAGRYVGSWTTVGQPIKAVEGPAVFRDNLNPNKVHLWVDQMEWIVGHNGYINYETTDIRSGNWQRSPTPINLNDIRHGCVTPLTQEQYLTIVAGWGV